MKNPVKHWNPYSKLCQKLLDEQYRKTYRRYAELTVNSTQKPGMLRSADEAETAQRIGRATVKISTYNPEYQGYIRSCLTQNPNESFMEHVRRKNGEHNQTVNAANLQNLRAAYAACAGASQIKWPLLRMFKQKKRSEQQAWNTQ